MKEPDRNIVATYRNSYQTAIITKTPETFPDPEMTNIVPDTGVYRPNTDVEMTHHKNKNIHKSTRQKLRKNDVYQTKMHNIYNLIFDHTNKQLQ